MMAKPMKSLEIALSNGPVFNNVRYYLTCVCSRYNARSDWLILGHCSPVQEIRENRISKQDLAARSRSEIFPVKTSLSVGK